MQEEIPFHPLANIFPLLEGVAFRDLVEDIRVHGLIEPIVLLDGMVLDGRNRVRACHAAQVPSRFKIYDGRSALAFVISANLHRRHLDVSQRALIAASISERLYGGRRGSSTKIGGKNPIRPRPERLKPPLAADKPSSEAAAHLLNVSSSSVSAARRVIESGIPELLTAVKDGEVPVSSAATIAAFDHDRQRNILRSGSKVVAVLAREEISARKNQRSKRDAPKVSAYRSLRVGDGRAIGALRIGELSGVAESLDVAAQVIREILGHVANPDHSARVSSIVTERWLAETVDRVCGELKQRRVRA